MTRKLNVLGISLGQSTTNQVYVPLSERVLGNGIFSLELKRQ